MNFFCIQSDAPGAAVHLDMKSCGFLRFHHENVGINRNIEFLCLTKMVLCTVYKYEDTLGYITYTFRCILWFSCRNDPMVSTATTGDNWCSQAGVHHAHFLWKS